LQLSTCTYTGRRHIFSTINSILSAGLHTVIYNILSKTQSRHLILLSKIYSTLSKIQSILSDTVNYTVHCQRYTVHCLKTQSQNTVNHIKHCQKYSQILSKIYNTHYTVMIQSLTMFISHIWSFNTLLTYKLPLIFIYTLSIHCRYTFQNFSISKRQPGLRFAPAFLFSEFLELTLHTLYTLSHNFVHSPVISHFIQCVVLQIHINCSLFRVDTFDTLTLCTLSTHLPKLCHFKKTARFAICSCLFIFQNFWS